MATLGELAQAIGGELRGPAHLELTGVGSVEGAGPTEIAPVESDRYRRGAASSKAGAFVITPALAESVERPMIVTPFALASFNRIIEIFGLAPPPAPPGTHPTAVIEDPASIPATCSIGPFAVVRAGARLGERCVIGPHAVVEPDVIMGEGCRLEPGAVLHDGTRLGNRVRIGAQAVVGRQGFGFAPGPRGPVFLHHVGLVVIEDDVHIGAASMVDRARFDETRIGKMSALDNLVHMGHNTRVGERTFLAAQTGFAGNASVGSDCVVGGQAGIGNNCGVGDRSKVAGGTGVTKMWPAGSEVFWYPGGDRREVRRMLVALRRLGRKEG